MIDDWPKCTAICVAKACCNGFPNGKRFAHAVSSASRASPSVCVITQTLNKGCGPLAYYFDVWCSDPYLWDNDHASLHYFDEPGCRLGTWSEFRAVGVLI
jgi:hypothetical protein